tara:strand:+ start:4480 stop:4935 length:456 start_codon:yes stop_codon:yes gene_type:complete
MSNLKIGEAAPSFEAKNQAGETVSLSKLKGKKVVLYFYPKDDTPGCTAEACNLRDNYNDLKAKGYEVIGVSADKAEKHQKFIAKYDLPFQLIADEDKKVINAYNAWGPKKFMGKEYEGIIRKTFVIDEEGKIENIIEKVKTKDHTAQILNA